MVLDKSQVIAFGLIRAGFAKKLPSSTADDAGFKRMGEGRFAQIHHFETITGAIWKLAIHHPRRMRRQPFRNAALVLTLVAGFLHVIVATIKFKIALKTDVCLRLQGFRAVKELAAIWTRM